MDTSDPDIQFDNKGICNHCTEFFNSTSDRILLGDEGRKALEAEVETMKRKGRGSKYDCVLGVSGGVDSSYAALIAKEYGLRVLCVHMDNGWNAEEAVKNIKNIVNLLGFDYESYVLRWQQFRKIQLAVLKSSIVEVEIPTDVAIVGCLHRVAAKHNVKYILSGGNFATEGILPNRWFYDAKDLRLLRDICKKFGRVSLKGFPTFSYWEEIYYKFFKGIRMSYILNYVDYDKDKAKSLLEEKYKWQYYGGKHYESRFTGFVQSFYQFKKFNVDYRRATLSTMICTGAVSREEALEQISHPPYDDEKVDRESDYIAKKLGISRTEFDEILNSEPKSYRDYKNNERFLEFVYGAYRRIFN